MRPSLTHATRLGLVALLSVVATSPARAADVKVLTTGAFKPVVSTLVGDFEARTGHRVEVVNDTAGAVAKRVAAGEPFDLLVLTPGTLQDLARAGTVGQPVRLARVAIGVAVRQGAPAPDIGSVAAFRQALLAARAVATIDPAAGGSSGIYLWQLFEKMGVAEQLMPRAVLVPGGLVAQRLLDGQADLAIHQISEILAVPGATLVGPLPADIQNHTVYAGAVGARARDAAAAQAFLDTLSGPAAAQVLAAKGMEAP
jgi:molybdate transport system substrate-binding protein